MPISSRFAQWMDAVAAAGLSLLVGFPLGWIAAMFLTPLLGRLEPILHTELAGHSGPSDSIFYLVWATLVPALFAFFFRTLRARRRSRLHLSS